MGVPNIYLTNEYEIKKAEKVPIVKNSLGREGLQFIQTLTNAKHKPCKIVEGPFEVLWGNSSQNTNTVLSFEYCLIYRQVDQTRQEWMGRLKSKS